MKKNSVGYNQEGIVSIVVTMLIMIVLTLIVTGFSQLARREQKEALDRQLSNQAFYAAESGVNDAVKALRAGYADDKNTCGPIPNPAVLSDNVINPSGPIEYSCLLIKQSVPDIKLDLPIEKSKSLPLNIVDSNGAATSAGEFNITWSNTTGQTNSIPDTDFKNFPSITSWSNDNASVLKVDIIPSSILNPTALSNNLFSVFLYPNPSSDSIVYSNVPTEKGLIKRVICDGQKCTAKITGLTESNYFVRFKSIYKPVTLSMCVSNCDGNKLIKGAQQDIDSTGKANDVFRRIRVRVSEGTGKGSYLDYPENTLDSIQSICKNFSVVPNGYKEEVPCN